MAFRPPTGFSIPFQDMIPRQKEAPLQPREIESSKLKPKDTDYLEDYGRARLGAQASPETLSPFGTFLGKGEMFLEGYIPAATFGLIAPDIAKEKTEKALGLEGAIVKAAGSIAGTVTALKLTTLSLNIIPTFAAASKLAITAKRTGTLVHRTVAAGAHEGVVWGVYGFLNEAAKQVKEKDPNAIELVKSTVHDSIFGVTVGGTGGAFYPTARAVRSIASGTALATAGGLVRTLRGEEIPKEEIIFNFVLGTVFDAALGGPKKFFKPMSKRQKDMEKIAPKMIKAWEKMADDPKMAEKLNKELFSFVEGGEKGNPEMAKLTLSKIKEYSSLVKGLSPKRLLERMPPGMKGKISTDYIKASGRQKRLIHNLTTKVEGLEKAFSKKSPLYPAANKAYVEQLERIYGKGSAKDLSAGEAQYYIEELRRVLKQTFRDFGAPLDVSQIGKGTIISGISPPVQYGMGLNLGPAMMPGIRGKVMQEGMVQDSIKLMNFEALKWLNADGIKMGAKVTEAIFKKGPAVKSFKRLTEALNNPNFDPKTLPTKAHQEVFSDMRRCTDMLIKMLNRVEKYLGLKLTKTLKGYSRRVYEFSPPAQKKARLTEGNIGLYEKEGLSKGRVSVSKERIREPLPGELEYNPFQAYIDGARSTLKGVFLTEPRNVVDTFLKNYGEELEKPTVKFLRTFYRNGLLGETFSSDEAINSLFRIGPGGVSVGKVINIVAKKFGRELGPNYMREIKALYGSRMNSAFISYRLDMGTRNITQSLLGYGLYRSSSMRKAIFRDTPQWMQDAMEGQWFYKMSKGRAYELSGDLPTSTIGKIGQTPMAASHLWNVTKVMKAAAWEVADYILNPRYWHPKKGIPYADPLRIKGEVPPGGQPFFPSEMARIKNEMNLGGLTCEFLYSKWGMPTILQTAAGGIAFKFWSWPLNYSFGYMREMLSRGFKNRASWADPVKGPFLPVKRARFGAIRHLAVTASMVKIAKKAGIDLTSIGFSPQLIASSIVEKSIAPLQMGPIPSSSHAIGIMINLYTYLSSHNAYDKKRAENQLMYYLNPGHLVPGSGAIKRVGKALEEGTPMPILFKTPRKEKRRKSSVYF